ncbi:MAG: hypothetical protein J4G10_02510 [Alphaproteobacteria bacterium]|nr:hypothetical protein [Alphaproteobacteria bacterium]
MEPGDNRRTEVGSSSSFMNRISRIALLLILLILLGGFVAFANWDIPPPAVAIEKVLPDERFPQ